MGFDDPDEPTLRAVLIKEPIEVDGLLNESAWTKAAIIDQFIQREPANGQPVSEKTIAKLFYDTDNLYFGIRCWDSNIDEIVATEMRRDNILMNNDAVEIYLDTYHDHRNAFYFATNPLGAQLDGIITSGLQFEEQNWDWNGVWECASTIDSTGWTVEIKIPFKTLRFKDQTEHIWGLNISRWIARKREEAYWSPISLDLGFSGQFRVDMFGHLEGLSDISHPEKFQIKPFVLSGIQRDFEEHEPYKAKLELGLDAKYLLTSNLTLDLSANTDFAQVEADQEQVNLTRFELFFPEKREFFLEGAGTFRFGERRWSPLALPVELFFSRRIGLSEDNEIVPLIGGAKLTGRTGSYNIGFMSMFANRTEYVNDDDESVKIPRTNFTALRVKRDILENSYIGVTALNKESIDDDYYNRTFGIDANFYLSENTQVSGFAAKTGTPDLSNKDLALYGDILHVSDLWQIRIGQNMIEENFNPEMGFVPRTDIRTTNINLGYSPRPDFLGLRQVFFFNDFYYYAKLNGQLESRQNFFGIWNQFQSGAYLLLLFGNNYERLFEEFELSDDVTIPIGIYEFNGFFGEIQSDQSKFLSGKVSGTFGDFFDGTLSGFGFAANWKLGNRITLELQYNYNDIRLPYGSFKANLLSSRMLYTFSPKMYVKAFVQWNSDNESITGNFLFNLIHTPGSDLYIVYNEEISTENSKLSPKNRTLLVKFTYLFSL